MKKKTSFQSEQSGSDFSLDDAGQAATLINEDEYISTSVCYEAPIQCGDSIVQQTLVSEDKSIRTIKTDKGKQISFDDYELQEKLARSNEQSLKDFKVNSEDDTNESNM